MKKKLIIFDFDGTIVDSFDVTIEIVNQLLRKMGRQDISKGEIEELRNVSLGNFFRKLKIPLWRLPFFVWNGRKKYVERMDEIVIVEKMPEIISELKRRGYVLALLTLRLNSNDSVSSFLKKNNLNLFDAYHFRASLLGKQWGICKLARNFNLEEVFYVGDEVRDIAAAKKAGVRSVAVSWGLNSKKALLRCQPDYLIDHPEGLLDVFLGSGDKK